MLKEVIRRVRPIHPLETPPTRISIHPVGHHTMPSLRWWDGDKTPTHHKLPLLGLKLSSNSFLDSSLEDDLSAATVYTIRTTEASTTVLRYGNSPLEIATINWPGAVPTNEARGNNNPPVIKMKGCRWSKGSELLRSGSKPNSSRKFNIPEYYSHTMKWKRYDTSYWCTTSAIKGPIAILNLANGQEPIRLVVYDTLRDKSDSRVLPAYKGVSFLLLDYLIVTALLCVTDVLAWKEICAMQDIAPWNDTNSGQELDNVSQFPDHSSSLWSGELGSKHSESSSTLSAFPQSPSRSYSSGMPAPDVSRSMWYTDTPKIQDSFKDCLTKLSSLHSTTPSSSTEAAQDPGASASHSPVTRPTHGSRNTPLALPLLSQRSRPSTSTGTSASSFSKPEWPELSRSLNQSTTTSILSPQQSPFGLDNKEGSPPELLLNTPKSPNAPNGSESYRRPLPKPPRGLALRRTTSTHTFRSLPPTPLLEVSEEPDESRSTVSGNSRLHSRSPPMMKASQEPVSVVFDLPPPSYSSIYFAQGTKPNSITRPTTTTAPST